MFGVSIASDIFGILAFQFLKFGKNIFDIVQKYS